MAFPVEQDSNTQGNQLDSGPPKPPPSKQSLMNMATGGRGGDDMSIDNSSPAIQAMQAMGETRQALLKLSALLPTLAPGVQQIIAGLESVVPQQVADMVSGQPPGSSGSGLGGAQQGPPTAPPVQAGTP